jgi:hypothetical protein
MSTYEKIFNFTEMFFKTAAKSSQSLIKGKKARIKALEEELKTCTTPAMKKSVQQSLDDAKRQLEELTTSKK